MSTNKLSYEFMSSGNLKHPRPVICIKNADCTNGDNEDDRATAVNWGRGIVSTRKYCFAL